MNVNEAKNLYEAAKRARAEAEARVQRVETEFSQVAHDIEQIKGQLVELEKQARRAIREFAGGSQRSAMHDAAAELAAARAQLQQLEVVHDNCESVLEEEVRNKADLGGKLDHVRHEYRAAIVEAVSYEAAKKVAGDMLDALALRGIDTSRSLSEQLGQVAQRAFARIDVDKADLGRRCDKLLKHHALEMNR